MAPVHDVTGDGGLINLTGPVLIFGGPYSNVEATAAVLDEARRRGIPPGNIVCTGDLAAYCADPQAVINLVRESGIRLVMGNCEESLATEAAGCGCGFSADSACAALSSQWYPYVDRNVDAESRVWMASLPRRLDLEVGGRRLAVIHGSVTQINRFVFASSDDAIEEELTASGCNGVIGGHCGLPFTRETGGRLWHNAGVVGMPANDGTPRVWFSTLTAAPDGLILEHHALDYDHARAAAKMRAHGLPAGYADCLETGMWPSCDVLTPTELTTCGRRLAPGRILWRSAGVNGDADCNVEARWPIHESSTLRDQIKVRYTEAARSGASSDAACCGDAKGTPANWDPIIANLYDAKQTCCLPREAVAASLGCGNPTAIAELKPGEIILDLGCGGGIDVLLAARQIGPDGHAYGVDMTDDMLELACSNQRRAGLENIDFLKGTIETIPLPDRSVDVIISNCVVNLSADKSQVFAEAYRVLKPGGRLAISDVATRGPIPAAVRQSVQLWLSCIAGALEVEEFRAMLAAAGFRQIAIEPMRVYDIDEARTLLSGAAIDVDSLVPQVAGKIVSASVRATKPARRDPGFVAAQQPRLVHTWGFSDAQDSGSVI
jgi:SAM-dependent methyltransferase/predicted phosphodiesterase